MERTDQLQQNATRVELDQRSRDARLRLEQVERLLIRLPLRRQSLLRRVLRSLGPRAYVGRQIARRSRNASLSRVLSRRRGEMADETGGAAGDFPAAPSAFWPNCAGRARVSQMQAEPGVSPPGPTARVDLRPWDHCCGLGDQDSHLLSEAE
jgi:hypothetical protein